MTAKCNVVNTGDVTIQVRASRQGERTNLEPGEEMDLAIDHPYAFSLYEHHVQPATLELTVENKNAEINRLRELLADAGINADA